MSELKQGLDAKAVRLLQVLLFSLILLYLGRALFVPMSFGLLVAIVSYPITRFLENHGWPRILAVLSVLFTIALLFLALIWLLLYEANIIVEDLPDIQLKLNLYLLQVREWLSGAGLDAQMQVNMLDKIKSAGEGQIAAILSRTVTATSSTAVSLFLIPVFAALFLLHRRTFVKLAELLAGEKYRDQVQTIILESITSYFRFIKGTFFVYCIVGLLNSLGLLMLGIEHAFLFGVVTAFMTIIPYVGIIISAALPVTMALITKDSAWYAVGVVAVFTFVQYLEANLIFPKIVGQQLGLSTFSVVVVMVTGTLLWGLAGMILFTPFAAIIKTIATHAGEWKGLRLFLEREEN